jgi:hypothetical protein
MRPLILALLSAGMLACNPDTGPNFGYGDPSDDTGETDTADNPDSDCAPTFGAVEASIDDYPGKGWVVEVVAPFTEGTCSMADGSLYIEHDDGSGGTATEGPFSIGFDDEDVWIQDYDDVAGTGELFFAFVVDSSTEQATFTLWVQFGDGSASEHVEVSAS